APDAFTAGDGSVKSPGIEAATAKGWLNPQNYLAPGGKTPPQMVEVGEAGGAHRDRQKRSAYFQNFRKETRAFAALEWFGIDPRPDRTGYGCVETDGSRHRLMTCGAISAPASATFPEKLLVIHSRLTTLLAECRPDCVAIENLFHAANVRSALKLGHARGV